MSIGRAGAWNSPEVRRVERDVFERCIKAGIPPRAELNSPKDLDRFLEMGVKDFCMGTDIYILYDWLRDNGKVLRSSVEKVFGAAPTRPIGPAWATSFVDGGSSNGHAGCEASSVADTAEARPPHA
jgi:hypothetical protein